jgi:hypothetical protein
MGGPLFTTFLFSNRQCKGRFIFCDGGERWLKNELLGDSKMELLSPRCICRTALHVVWWQWRRYPSSGPSQHSHPALPDATPLAPFCLQGGTCGGGVHWTRRCACGGGSARWGRRLHVLGGCGVGRGSCVRAWLRWRWVSRLHEGGGEMQRWRWRGFVLLGWYSLLEIATAAIAYHLLCTQRNRLFTMRFCNTPLKSALGATSSLHSSRPYCVWL